MRRARELCLPLLLVLGLGLGLAGCGEEEKREPLTVGGDGEPSADASNDASPSADAEAPFDDEGNDAVRGEIQAEGEAEEAVVDAWFAYWDVRTQSFFDAKVDPALGTVAAATAVSDVVRYVSYLRSKKLTTVGDSKFDVTDVAVKGSSATLKSCVTNKSIDQDADGRPAEAPVPFFTAEGDLTKAGGTWRVVAVRFGDASSCAG